MTCSSSTTMTSCFSWSCSSWGGSRYTDVDAPHAVQLVRCIQMYAKQCYGDPKFDYHIAGNIATAGAHHGAASLTLLPALQRQVVFYSYSELASLRDLLESWIEVIIWTEMATTLSKGRQRSTRTKMHYADNWKKKPDNTRLPAKHQFSSSARTNPDAFTESSSLEVWIPCRFHSHHSSQVVRTTNGPWIKASPDLWRLALPAR